MIKTTPRLILTQPHQPHAAQFVDWLNDPEVVKYSEQRHKTHTIESQQDYWRSAATSYPNFINTVSLKDPLQPIGSVAVRMDTDNQIANVGIMIGDKTQWGKGYGYEAWECVCNYLFTAGGVRRIEAGCMAINDPMIKICEKFRMTRDAMIPNHFMIDKFTASLVLFGKNR